MSHVFRFLLIIPLIAVLSGAIIAQEAPPEPTPEVTPETTPEVPFWPPSTIIEVEATDGRTLIGDYYELPDFGYTPVVLLIHELYTSGVSWMPIIGPLVANGYRVLNIDVRGTGGRTRGAINWNQAREDTQTWLEWLYQQPGVRLDAVFLIGSSMGSSLALVGCEAAQYCAGVVAISPGLNYFGVRTRNAILSGFPALLVYADDDYYSARDVPLMEAMAEENNLETLTTLIYSGRTHGVALFAEEDFIPAILEWLSWRR